MDEKLVITLSLKLYRLSRDAMQIEADDWSTLQIPLDDGADMEDTVAGLAKIMYRDNYDDLLANMKERGAR